MNGIHNVIASLIDTDNKYIDCKQDGKKIKVTEKKHSLFNSDNSELVIYIPSDMTACIPTASVLEAGTAVDSKGVSS